MIGDGDWLVIEQQGGLIQDYTSSGFLDDIALIEIDYDELREGMEPLDYYGEKLLQIRAAMPPGDVRRILRQEMAEAVAWVRYEADSKGFVRFPTPHWETEPAVVSGDPGGPSEEACD